MHFPKLLVVAEFPPNAPTLNVQCLKGFPAEQIYWWSCMPETTSIYGQKYSQHFYCRLPRRLLGRRRLPRLKAWFVENFWVPYAARHLRRTLATVKPDRVWLNLYGWAIAPIWCSGIVGTAPSHVTIWDFPDTEADQKRWGSSRCLRALQQALSVYRACTSCDAISEPMRDELAVQTGRRDISILHSGLEDVDLANLSMAPTMPHENAIRIAYAGSIIEPEVFALFVNSLRHLAEKTTRPISLEFFGGTAYRQNAWFDSSWMHEHGALKEAVFLEQLRRCTWGFLAMDIEDRNPRYNRFSFPNKFGTYLAAGLPILLLSGPQTSAAKMLAAQQVGVRLDHTRLPSHLLEVLNIEHPKNVFAPAILSCAKAEFYMPRIRRALWQNLGVREDHAPQLQKRAGLLH